MAKDNPPAAARVAPTRATFIDTAFRSRLIVLPSGDVLAVRAGNAEATTAQQIEYLDAHPDFCRIEDRR